MTEAGQFRELRRQHAPEAACPGASTSPALPTASARPDFGQECCTRRRRARRPPSHGQFLCRMGARQEQRRDVSRGDEEHQARRDGSGGATGSACRRQRLQQRPQVRPGRYFHTGTRCQREPMTDISSRYRGPGHLSRRRARSSRKCAARRCDSDSRAREARSCPEASATNVAGRRPITRRVP